MTELNMDSPEVKALLEKVRSEEQTKTKMVADKNNELLGEIKSLKGKLKGYDPDKMAELEKMVRDADDKKHQKNIEDKDIEAVVSKYESKVAELEKRLSDTVATKDTEVKTAQDALKNLESSYTKSITEGIVLDALAKRKVSPDAMKNNILPLLETVVENGKFRTIVKDGDGEKIDPSTNKPVTVDGLLDEFSVNPAFAPLFPQSSGSNANGSKFNPNMSTISKISDFKTEKEKVDYQDKYGMEAYKKLSMS